MKRTVWAFLSYSALLLVTASCNNSGNKVNNNPNEIANMDDKSLFPLGEDAPADFFTGTAHIYSLISPDQVEGYYTVGQVTFDPGGKTNWHTHPAGQVLIVTEGRGWYQERGKPAQELTKGCVVAIPKDIEHWHGAAADSRFVHIAISNMKESSNVTWQSPVNDEEYKEVNK